MARRATSRHLLLAAAAAAVFGGCFSTLSHPLALPPPPPAVDAGDEVAGSPGPLTAARLLTRARVQFPQVSNARARRAAAEARARAAGLSEGLDLDGRVLAGLDGAVGAEAALLVTLPLGDRRAAARRVSEAELGLATLEVELAEQDSVLGLRRELVRLAHSRARLQLLRAVAARSREIVALARSQRAASLGDGLDVPLAVADSARDEQAAQREAARERLLVQRIRSLLRLGPTVALAAPPMSRLSLPAEDEPLRSRALQRAPPVRQALLRFRSAEAAAAAQAALRWPDLRLGPALALEGDGIAAGLSLGIELPSPQAGAAAYRAALAERDASAQAYWSERRAATLLVDQTLNVLRRVEAELDALQGDARRAMKEAVAVAEGRYAAGELDLLRLLGIHRAAASLDERRLDLLLEQHEALIQLERVIGAPLGGLGESS